MNDEVYKLNDDEVEKIISTTPTKIENINIFSDIYLTEKEKVEQAANILKLKKWKK